MYVHTYLLCQVWFLKWQLYMVCNIFIVLPCNKICAAEILTPKTPSYCIMGNNFNILVHTYLNYMHVDVREDVGNWAKCAEFDAAVRRRHMVTKQDIAIANIWLMVKDMTVIRNKELCQLIYLFKSYRGSLMIQFCCITATWN